jgi:hypothetical protein
MPGVEGGVKAGETSPGRDSSETCSSCDSSCDSDWLVKELRSSSEIARETGIGRGE